MKMVHTYQAAVMIVFLGSSSSLYAMELEDKTVYLTSSEEEEFEEKKFLNFLETNNRVSLEPEEQRIMSPRALFERDCDYFQDLEDAEKRWLRIALEKLPTWLYNQVITKLTSRRRRVVNAKDNQVEVLQVLARYFEQKTINLESDNQTEKENNALAEQNFMLAKRSATTKITLTVMGWIATLGIALIGNIVQASTGGGTGGCTNSTL